MVQLWNDAPQTTAAADAVPPWVARVAIVLGQSRPVGAAEAIEIIDDFAVPQRHLAVQSLRTFEAGVVHVEEAEIALLDPQHGDVGCGADRQMAEVLLLDGPRWLTGGPVDDLIE